MADASPRFRFFGGKGGVGKTTLSAATAVALAEAGGHVLVLSTDPAHSLGDALQTRLSASPRRIRTARGRLEAAEIDALAALERWFDPRRQLLGTIAERGTYLDREDVERFLNLAFPGVDELIGLLEIVRLADAGDYTHVVVDTAPTGHTLRLLEMPDTLRRIAGILENMQDKHRLIAESLGARWRRDSADLLIQELEEDAIVLRRLLTDPARASFSWVLIPEALPVEETLDGVPALERAGIGVDVLWVNRVRPPPRTRCKACETRRRGEAASLGPVEEAGLVQPMRLIAELEVEPRGLEALRKVASLMARPVPKTAVRAGRKVEHAPTTSCPARVPLRLPDTTRLLLFGGKGGVGKSTCAATAALSLAAHSPDKRVLLLSTDPAHNLGDVLEAQLGNVAARVRGAPSNLDVRELDAVAAFAAERERYREAVDSLFDALRRGTLDASYDRAIVRELIDLAPPGLDELFATMTVMDAAVAGAANAKGAKTWDLVVVDTAPTGHALRMLQLPEQALEWVRALLAILLKYREVIALGRLAEDLVKLSRDLKNLIALQRDPSRTRFVVVTRAAGLPREETLRLARELHRLEIASVDVVVNGVSEGTCSRCLKRARQERGELSALTRRLAALPGEDRAVIVTPALAPPPRGVMALTAFGERWQVATPRCRRARNAR